MPQRTSARRSGDTAPKRIVNELTRRWARSHEPESRNGLVGDALDLVDRVVLAVDRQQRRRLGEIDRIDHALYLGRDSDGIGRAVGRGRGELVPAIRPLRAVVASAAPGEGLIVAGVDGVAAVEDGLAGAVGARDGDVATSRCRPIPGHRT